VSDQSQKFALSLYWYIIVGKKLKIAKVGWPVVVHGHTGYNLNPSVCSKVIRKGQTHRHDDANIFSPVTN
jgi:hypothetical protein